MCKLNGARTHVKYEYTMRGYTGMGMGMDMGMGANVVYMFLFSKHISSDILWYN